MSEQPTSPRPTESSAGAVAEQTAQAEQTSAQVLRKVDTSSRFRTNLGWWAWVIGGISIVFTLYHLYAALERPFNTWMHSSLHLAGATALIFFLYPASKRLLDAPASGNRVADILIGRGKGIPWYDVLLGLAALACNLYVFFEYTRLVSNSVQILGYSELDIVVAILGVLLILEATRRCVGLPIVIIAGVALLYGLFGNYLPVFKHSGQSAEDLATNMFLSSGGGIFGTPIQVSANFIFLFLFFAVMLVHTNIGQFFNDLAFRLTGRYTGGPAKAAVVASGLQGMVSGSSVANTVASGSFTIPLMKRAGFKSHFAAATEATASTGGQLMPPIMGAAAFIMAQNVPDLEYNGLIVIAIIPAMLYFLGAFLSIHFEAKTSGILGMAKSSLPNGLELLKRLDLLLPLVVIILTLLSGMSPIRAALFGIGTGFILSFLRKTTRLGPRAFVNLLIAGARTALPVIAACATAGIVAGTVTVTGLGGQLGKGLVDLAGGNFFIVLFMVMIACLVLGMGLPTTANYVVTATIAAPILYNNFDVPLIAAHMFVFFFGILADITPPVCLAAYAGAGIAGANPMRAGVTALRIAIAGFLIPYVFILEPAILLQGSWQDTVLALVTVIVGMCGVAAGMAGYFFGSANAIERLLLVVGGIALVYPSLWISVAGLIVLVIVAVEQKLRKATTAEQIAKANVEQGV
ncbi:TRAP transporter permease [Brevibacterium aurantiacum]|uniref:C4-dicarboxylate ABC transporter n=1 Tax=Brevibacterium aurantiacum TaxID=273384 RepID=A0A2A3ZQR7_BREAU|nr:TRAP transporter permease [Brevibacterium aurantiacum]MDN5586776.1 TRAP transporter permease [Brevibacterium sp.]AZT98494.1 C4-dicarboxylate ABC transporter [Brevibacterium aurantiacum]PCC53866.1 C4-dicarboxylate ABC transporter [Brevibacterium aurantiacum]TGD40874.1 TRAP transporter permease [Brevibacterium aurantiacum]SMX77409.1 TRAP transporter, 4TM/12TM fusion protein [Brevibacterium aurantiacum]